MRDVPDGWIISQICQPLASMLGRWITCYNIARMFVIAAIIVFIAKAGLWSGWHNVTELLYTLAFSFLLGYLAWSLLQRIRVVEQLSRKTCWAEGRYHFVLTRLFFCLWCVTWLILSRPALVAFGVLILAALYSASCDDALSRARPEESAKSRKSAGRTLRA